MSLAAQERPSARLNGFAELSLELAEAVLSFYLGPA